MKILTIIMIQYIIFGIIDNVIMYKSGDSIEAWLRRKVLHLSSGRYTIVDDTGNKLTLFCAAIGNAISDFAGGLFSFNPLLAVCSFIGCMLVAAWIGVRLIERA